MWFPLLLAAEKLKLVLKAPFVLVAEMLQRALRELSVISAGEHTVKGFGTSSSPIIEVFFKG